MRLIIDRIEDGIAVCEELSENPKEPGRRHEFDINELPKGAREGDVIDYENNKSTLNPGAASERREHIKKLMNDVFGDGS